METGTTAGQGQPRPRANGWRRRLGRRLSWAGPAWVVLAFFAVTVLGVVGFTRYQVAAGALEPVASRVYQALQLFVLESGSVDGDLPWELHVARFLAPIVAAYAVLRALAALFGDRVDSLRLGRLRDHVVVAGLGRKGTALAEQLIAQGEAVVAIEADPSNPSIESLRASGAFVVIGDARSPATLARAGVGRAATLAALCPADGANIEILARARHEVRGDRPVSLRCVVHVADPVLAQLLWIEELERYGEAPVRTEVVNVHGVAAEALLAAVPPRGSAAHPAQRLAVVGGGPTARHLLPALARAASAPDAPVRGPVTLLVVAMAAPDVATLSARHPELATLVRLEPVADLRAIAGPPPPSVVYIVPDDDERATTLALELRALLAGAPATIVVALTEHSGLGQLLDGMREIPGGPRVRTFGLLDEACAPELLLSGTTERLARALHERYRHAGGGAELGGANAGHAGPGDPALRPWADLPPGLRESTRDQAAHVAVKLAAIGRAVGPMADWHAARQPFADDEVEVMARLEHDRWVAERRRAGWSAGPRDVERRTTPYLVPWEALSEEVRDKDRLFVRGLPELLAAVGLQALPTPVRSPSGTPVNATRA